MVSNNVKICSMNVRGLGDEGERKDVFTLLKNKYYAIYCLDIHIGEKNTETFIKGWGGEVSVHRGKLCCYPFR